MDSAISAINNFLQTIAIKPGDKILAAVSGGADSIAMLHLLFQSKIINNQLSITCVHINHHLRGQESYEDQKFVETLCAAWNIPLFIEQIDVKSYAAKEKLSIETAARQLRLEALERIAKKTGCKYIATAHHKDDQAETVLFRLQRGTAFAGLAGIRPTREHHGLQWIRPLLNIRRSEIESYCTQNNITWRTDASNIETHYRRNWIRHCLLPHLQQNSNSDLTEKLATLAQSALLLQQKTESVAAQIWQQPRTVAASASEPILKTGDSHLFSQSKITLSAAAIQQAGPFVAGEILRTVLTHLNCGLRDITLSHYQNFFQLLDKTRGTLQLPSGCTLRKKSNALIFEAVNSPKEPCFTPNALKLSINNNQLSITQFAGWSIQTRIIKITQADLEAFQKQKDNCKQWFDYQQIQSPLMVRPRQDDDAFTPFGRKNKKRISRFLTDSQIPENLRNSCLIIEDNSGILWLAPIRRSALAPVTSDTIEVLEIRIEMP
jgi:tRNA(Ile)-lysidine synthase